MRALLPLAVLFLLASTYAQEPTCPEGEVLCEGTVDECIKKEWVCDGTHIDCSNSADESDCPCEVGYFQCPNTTYCFPSAYICDFDRDCPGGEDEQNCEGCTGFTCDNGECINDDWVCDGTGDCEGGEDEFQDWCECGSFLCSNGDCIPMDWTCDGHPDCSNDEETCPCAGFQCPDSEVCIPPNWKCDGYDDCNDGSDEANCTRVAAPSRKQSIVLSHSVATPGHVKSRKSLPVGHKSKRQIKNAQKRIRDERRDSSCSRASRRQLIK